MNRLLFGIVATLVIFGASCKGGPSQSTEKSVALLTNVDSMSYAVGMNIGAQIMLIDSAINIDAVCQGIKDIAISNSMLTDEEARYAIMKHMNYDTYERVKRYEQRILEDLRKADRKYYATTSGISYKISEMGDVKRSPKNLRDTLMLNCRIMDMKGIVDTTYYKNDTLRIALGDMVKGLQETARLIGEGGHIEAWIPSSLAYGAAGCDSLNVAPNTMLYYEMKLIEVERK